MTASRLAQYPYYVNRVKEHIIEGNENGIKRILVQNRSIVGEIKL